VCCAAVYQAATTSASREPSAPTAGEQREDVLPLASLFALADLAY
jgi:hypothetical protein